MKRYLIVFSTAMPFAPKVHAYADTAMRHNIQAVHVEKRADNHVNTARDV